MGRVVIASRNCDQVYIFVQSFEKIFSRGTIASLTGRSGPEIGLFIIQTRIDAGYSLHDENLPFFFASRFHWIRRIGRPAPREVAPIVVSNHVSFTDPIFHFWELLPVFVSSTSHDDIFMVGPIIRAMEVSYEKLISCC